MGGGGGGSSILGVGSRRRGGRGRGGRGGRVGRWRRLLLLLPLSQLMRGGRIEGKVRSSVLNIRYTSS